MENTVKMTKAMYFAELREMVLNTVEDAEKQDELLAFIDRETAILEKRKVAAANRAEKKRAESDALTDAIFACITNKLATVDEIVLALGAEDVTRNKVTARLGKLVKAGLIEKDAVKVESKKRMAYRLPGADDAEGADAAETVEE